MVLQPSEERRRSGSHYTPRALTEPIVRTTLDPILARMRGADGRAPRPAQILDLKVCDPAMGSGAFLVEACRQLAGALVEAWNAHGGKPAIPPDEDDVVFAMRLVVQRCLYGVDRNPVAVDLAKVSLWLATLAKDHPLTFLDHALRHGDSLVGLSQKQIEAFHWKGDAPAFQAGFETMQVREHVAKVADLRRLIREADENVSDWELRDLWDEALLELRKVRLFGDLLLAAFFKGETPKEREGNRSEYASAVVSGETDRYRGWLDESRHGDPPLVPFHWEIEFPEVFERENSGFDAIAGNPPFAGKNALLRSQPPAYLSWLKELHSQSHGNSDLVAHFFRRAFLLVRKDGCVGLLATNSIAQGDTRSTGLRFICTHGGNVYSATKRVRWPGQAAVVVSIVHFIKGDFTAIRLLNGRPVKRVSAYLFPNGPDDAPIRLSVNLDTAFKGAVIMGDGFIFSDPPREGGAGPTEMARRLLTDGAESYSGVILPYIAGGELNDMPNPAATRFIISFGEMSEREARRWPELMRIVEEKVKPYRLTLGGNRDAEVRRKYWWRWGRYTPALYNRAASLSRVLVCAHTGPHKSFVFLPPNTAFDQSLIVFCLERWAEFAGIQSRVHGTWNEFQGSSMKDDLRYTPSDCFETFPFPENWGTHVTLEAAGKAYYEFRGSLMVKNDEGLTKTYNRFHDPEERGSDIARLRELHAAMDRAVLDAYGWSDIPTSCEFLLDYEINEDDWGDRKKPWRYRWTDEVRDEVLARLLELNAERAREEARAGVVAAMNHGKKSTVIAAARPSKAKDVFS
jgi:hypothetical protein